eukprot:Protomagalhaensia_sp_Gyna_25__1521@NODE_1780_length_1541_cov_499_292943_g1459_i0_p2_GENE_NODE_1780_length_1541_cov_499_292943_g1459_i0NODE_1780_length_1541_cov_499_292943_g1459_i0_p2_ORF_typecomplete_len188_score11_55ATG27/PF09451_10/0_014Lipocalin_7/PF14651_6/0_13_NODE_1780_length_1541_cov_499_292943_g1459_i09331496
MLNFMEQVLKELRDVDCVLSPDGQLCDFQEFVGEWQLLLNESESCDEHLQICGISRIQRTMFKSAAPITRIEVLDQDENGEPLRIKLTSLQKKKKNQELELPLDGSYVEHEDSFTQSMWISQCLWIPEVGSVVQKRVCSNRGTHYDVRRVYRLGTDTKMLFLWIAVSEEGLVFKANRWLCRKTTLVR